jgi:hypothetical protein
MKHFSEKYHMYFEKQSNDFVEKASYDWCKIIFSKSDEIKKNVDRK